MEDHALHRASPAPGGIRRTMSTATALSDSFSYRPQPGRLIYSDKPSGQTVDLTPVITAGAKFTVVYDAVCQALGTPRKAGSALYHRIYRQVERWQDAGLVQISRNVVDPLSVELSQKRGLYVTATLNLIKGMQNSNNFAKPDQPTPAGACSILPSRFPKRCSAIRKSAIAVAMRIKQYHFFIRPRPSQLNPHLVPKISQMEKRFLEWQEDCDEKQIILARTRGDGKPYYTLPVTTRFNNEGRKVEILKTYESGIENSLNLYDKAVFLTFTTDPLLHLSPQGQPVERIIKTHDGKKQLAKFETEGRGSSLYDANRHESEAWRRWYEAETRKRGYRIPYVRVVEFMKNGLIHTHVLLFGIDWVKPFQQLAYEWGVKYQQGFMVHAYVIRKRNGTWQWKDDKNTPDDSNGRTPDDYLKKYLKKALYDDTGYWGYWVHNKRFFTMSQSIRYATAEEAAAAKADRDAKKAKIPEYEFIGAVHENDVPDIVRRHSRGWQKEPVIPSTHTRDGLLDCPGNAASNKRPHACLAFTPANQWKHNDPAAVYAVKLEIDLSPPDPPPDTPAEPEEQAETYLEMIRRLKREARESDSSQMIPDEKEKNPLPIQ